MQPAQITAAFAAAGISQTDDETSKVCVCVWVFGGAGWGGEGGGGGARAGGGGGRGERKGYSRGQQPEH